MVEIWIAITALFQEIYNSEMGKVTAGLNLPGLG